MKTTGKRLDRATVRVARWSATHPWRAIALWVVFVATCVTLAGAVGTREAQSADFRVGEAGRAEAIAEAGGLTPQARENVIVTARSGRLDLAAAENAAADVARRMREVPAVAEVEEPVRADDGNALRVPIVLHGDDRAAKEHIEQVQAQTAAAQAEHPDLRIMQTGNASISKGNDVKRGEDFRLSESITLPVTLLVLLVAFGSVIAATVPVLIAVSSIVAAMGLSALASHLVPDAGVGSSVILLMGMAVGVDYALFYLRREREERRRAGGQLSDVAAVEIAAATSGHAVVVSGCAVLVSTACLYLAGDIIFSSLATGTIVVVLVAMAGSLTVLPAVLAKLGPWVDRLRLPFLGRTTGGSTEGRFWRAVLRPAMRRPLATLLVSGLAMLALALPVLGLQLNVEGKATFSRSIPAVQAYDRMLASFPNQRAAHQVAVRGSAETSAAVEQALRDLAQRAERDPAMAGATAAGVRTSKDGSISTLTLNVPHDPNSPRAVASLRELRTELIPASLGRLSGVEYAVSGDVARNVDYVTNQSEKTPLVVAFVLLLTCVMMFAAFRSAVLALLGVLLNLLSAGAALGVLVAVFQSSLAERLLGVTGGGFVGSRVPLFLFVILFGLSMDYQIFVVSRIKEAVQGGLSTRDAVLDGVTRSAGVVTSAAVVMTSVFVSFVFLSLLELKQIGFVLAVGIVLDAFVIRILVLPSALTLLGRASWWPGRLARITHQA